ncbi:Acyl-coenzyme A thioesterase PaaI, contains HGG motif [Rhodococcus rhodochrous J3]|uniref:Acyl-coenzyme A thioesterase THEM4 n=3 Tax=Rhodococcus rhodochrous TaxID=1829 RepID=A0A562E7B3_RHORH|nr:PaaI family thioesterase [Rhodococcus rhodochrous]MBF4478618.1 PaaI family thioesterase [Rhodococcus rhodochrous]MCB8913512.1 PaaI family thioesterase [Rhodococcus rhodochrous]MCD2099877.1 PaaI family thioesterase [Rhodococcus rhodochrous]MCD2124349.1 PaaI family thioesterase [Rhodococcus rhodochrous]MCQ4135858.1 PaaI family thioesterase [Rhodococcus rhodochrous]
MTIVENLSRPVSDVEREYAAALERDAAQLRRIVDLLQRVDVDDPLLLDVAEKLDALSEHLENPIDTVTETIRNPGWRHDPVSGVENAIAPPIVLEAGPDGTVTAEVEFGLPYQGPNSFVHGGISAMVMDHVLSAATAPQAGVIFTAQLTVRYHRPLPLFVPLTIAARLREREGRKIWATGEIVVDGKVAVSAEGLFIEPRPKAAQ